MRRVFIGCMLGLLLLLPFSPVEAIVPDQTRTVLSVRHCDGLVDTLRADGKVKNTTALAETMEFEIEPGETAVIQIKDPNPLIFKYSLTPIEKTDTANFKVAQDLLKAMTDLGTTLKAAAGGAREQALARAALAPTKTEINNICRMSPLSDSDLLSCFGQNLATLSDKLEAIPDLIEKSADCTAAEEVKSTVADWKVPELLVDLNSELSEISKRGLALAKKGAAKPADEVRVQMTQVQVQKPDIDKMIKTLKDFSEAAAGIHRPLYLDPTVVFDATHDGGVTLGVTVVEGSGDAVAKAKTKIGKFSFVVRPFSPVALAIGPAMIYSFIETQEFGTKTENGKITIVRKDSGDQLNGLTVGAMLSITPRAWSNPAFRRSIQFGASPVKDKLGLFLGGSVQFFTQVSIGGGIAYQQAQRLAPGLALNQEIASEDKLKTNIVFKSGFYLTITVNFGAKK